MILEQLRADAEHLLPEMAPPMYDRKPVRWLIDLSEDGRLNGFVALAGDGKHGKRMAVPYRKRSGMAIRPFILADSRDYVLGIADDHRAAEKHAGFKELVGACLRSTGNAAVRAVDLFLEWWTPGVCPLPEEMEPKDLLTFRVGEALPINASEVQAFWVAHCVDGAGASKPDGQAEGILGAEGGAGAWSAAAAGGGQECLVCGALSLIEDCLPLFVKGGSIPGGQTSGMALVSGEKEFESYGLKRGRTSPICRTCGESTHKALNALLAERKTHLRVGKLVYVFWTSAGDYSPLESLDQPDPETVRRLIEAYRTGRPETVEDAPAFHATALSASGGRAVVRDWLTTTVGAVKQNLGRWFEWQQLVDPYGEAGPPFGIYKLAASLYRDASKEMPALVPQQLARAALHGAPLPDALIAQALKRNRAEGGITHPRVALIKAVLASQRHGPHEGGWMTELNAENHEPAYLCGRLLAELEEIQRRAIPGINATLVDRYFGTASSAPASVFGRLLTGVQPHLSKLRKTSEPAFYGAQTRLEEIMAPLGGFPATLTLKQQALFSLGYYHQRAATRGAKAEAKARKAESQITEQAALPLAENQGGK